MGASAYPVKTHRKKRGCVKDLISVENNERGNNSVKKVSVNSYTISALHLHYSTSHHSSGSFQRWSLTGNRPAKDRIQKYQCVLTGGIVTQIILNVLCDLET
jgi:hypothetical protein